MFRLPPIPLTATIRERLRAIVLGVMMRLGDRVRQAPASVPPVGVLIPLAVSERIQAWLRLRQQRILALMDRIQAGRQRAPRPYQPRMGRAAADPAGPGRKPLHEGLPRGFGWLAGMAGEISERAHHLGPWLEDAEVKPMVLGTPQMVRLLVPLLNAVGQDRPAWFPTLPAGPRRSRAGETRVRRSVPRRSPPVASVPPPPPPLPPAAAWTGRGPGPCATLAEYRSPFEPPGAEHPPIPPGPDIMGADISNVRRRW